MDFTYCLSQAEVQAVLSALMDRRRDLIGYKLRAEMESENVEYFQVKLDLIESLFNKLLRVGEEP